MKKSFLTLLLLNVITYRLCAGGEGQLSSSGEWCAVPENPEASSEALTQSIIPAAGPSSSRLPICSVFPPYSSEIPANLTGGQILTSSTPHSMLMNAQVLSPERKDSTPRKATPLAPKTKPRKIERPSMDQAIEAIKKNDSPFFQKNYKLLNSSHNSEWIALLAQTQANVFVREATVKDAIKSITKGQATIIIAQEELAKAYIIQLSVQAAQKRIMKQEPVEQ